MRPSLTLFVSLSLGPLLGFTAHAQQESKPDSAAVSFSQQVAPIFVKNCLACHGQREPKGGFQLYTFELLMKPGDSSSPPITRSPNSGK